MEPEDPACQADTLPGDGDKDANTGGGEGEDEDALVDAASEMVGDHEW